MTQDFMPNLEESAVNLSALAGLCMVCVSLGRWVSNGTLRSVTVRPGKGSAILFQQQRASRSIHSSVLLVPREDVVVLVRTISLHQTHSLLQLV